MMDASFDEVDVSDKPVAVSARKRLTARTKAALTENHQQRLEALLSLDDAVGTIMQALTASGELDNTIVVFTTDNGYMLGEHRIATGKTVPYEPSTHLPLVARGPGFPAGAAPDQIVSDIDLAPTFIDAGDAQAGFDMDGTSLLPIVAAPGAGRDRTLVMEAGPIDVGHPMEFTGVRTDQWLYVEYAETGERELYDMVNDPLQLQSQHANPAYDDIRRQLEAQLAATRRCAGSTCRGGPAPPVAIRHARPDVLTRGAAPVEVRIEGVSFQPGATFSVSGNGIAVGVGSTVPSEARAELDLSVAADAAAGARDVTVRNPDGTSATCTACLTVRGGPAIASVLPSSRGQGALNQAVTLNGQGFTAATTVTVLGKGVTIRSSTVVSATVINLVLSVTRTATPGDRTLSVTNESGTATSTFTVNPAPVPTSVSAAIPAGRTQQVTVSGTGFVPATGLTVKIRSTGFSVGIFTSASASAVSVSIRSAPPRRPVGTTSS